MRNPYSKYKNKIAEKLASGKTEFKGETRSKGHRGSFYIDEKSSIQIADMSMNISQVMKHNKICWKCRDKKQINNSAE